MPFEAGERAFFDADTGAQTDEGRGVQDYGLLADTADGDEGLHRRVGDVDGRGVAGTHIPQTRAAGTALTEFVDSLDGGAYEQHIADQGRDEVLQPRFGKGGLEFPGLDVTNVQCVPVFGFTFHLSIPFLSLRLLSYCQGGAKINIPDHKSKFCSPAYRKRV